MNSEPILLRHAVVILSVAVLLGACGTGDVASAPVADASDKPDSSGKPDAPDKPAPPPPALSPDQLTPEEATFQTAFAAQVVLAQTLTAEEFAAAWPAPTPATDLGYDPKSAGFFAEIEAALMLTEEETAFIAERGFGSLPRLSFNTAHDGYHEIFRNDLPVYITADSVLFALHRSFSVALRSLEESVLSETLGVFLAKTQSAVTQMDLPAELELAQQDLDLYLAVARSLLKGEPINPILGSSEALAALLANVAAEELRTVTLFGSQRVLDFSQFRPRSHYTLNMKLERYFRTMIWLGRVDFRFREYDAQAQQWTWNDRQLQSAWLLNASVEAASSFADWFAIHSVIGALIGEVDAMDLHGMISLVGAEELSGPEALTGDLTNLHDALVSGGYGRQRIRSHFLATDPTTAEVTPLTMSFAVFGQRFTPDSFVFSKVVNDDVQGRRLPSPFDMLFALGSNAAGAKLIPEMSQWDTDGSNPYAANLHLMRFILDDYPSEFWDSSVYYGWLDGLRALNDVPENAPTVMHTAAFRDRLFNTQLSSWAELRHDTVLYGKQSYTGSEVCYYPAGYVGPIPAFWARMKTVGTRLSAALSATNLSDTQSNESATAAIQAWSNLWAQTMETLESIAIKQLAEQPLSDTEEKLIDHWIDLPTFAECGGPAYDGVYTALLLDNAELSNGKYTITDVHTNPGGITTDPPAILHAGTGRHQLLVFTRDSCEGATAYVGVISTFYEHEEGPELVRLTDEEWRTMLYNDPPPRPDWVDSFMVPSSAVPDED